MTIIPRVAFALTLASSFLCQAEILTLSPTDDSTLRVGVANQGSSVILFAGDTATSGDYLRSALAFDLSDPSLVGATINSVTLTLTVRNRDSGSSNLGQTINLHSLSDSFTNDGVTWTSRDGSNNWANPGGDFGGVLATVSANPSTLNTGDLVEFTSVALTTNVESAVGGPLHLLYKLATEDANRSVFSFSSQSHPTPEYRPKLVIDFTSDPALSQDLTEGDSNLNFGILNGNPPLSATRTLRFVNDGPNNAITIESAILSESNGVFVIDDIAINAAGGQTPPFVLQVGDSLAITVSAAAQSLPTHAEATLTLDTSEDNQDRSFSASASFIAPGSAVPHPAVPGKPASASYQVRIDGIPVPVNDESYFDFHTTFFSMDQPVMVEVEFLNGASYSSIHPLRHGIQPRIQGNTITFPMLEPHKLVIKAAGTLPLSLCATPLETNVPSPGDPNVLYFGPGTHEPGVIQATAGQTIYLAPGALVKGRIEVRSADNVTIRGRGTLDAAGYSVRGESTQGIRVQSSNNVHLSGFGFRSGTNWMTLFVLSDDCSVDHVSLIGKTVNSDGIDIDGVKNFVARNCFIRCEDDGFGWHAISAAAYGELPTRDCLAEDCVIWNTAFGNALRIGASMETELFENIIFRNIDVLEHANSAIHSDHSDWALCKNIRFENFTDETTKQTIEIFIDKTRYSSTGPRDERGSYDGLHFINVNSPGGGIDLRGFSVDHLIDNVTFRDCFRGTEPIDGPEDIVTNQFVTNVTFETADEPPLETHSFQMTNGWKGWTQLGYSSRYGRAYTIEASPDLLFLPPFTGPLQIPGSGPSSKALFYDPANLTAERRFFRVRKD